MVQLKKVIHVVSDTKKWKGRIFWDVTQYQLINSYLCFARMWPLSRWPLFIRLCPSVMSSAALLKNLISHMSHLLVAQYCILMLVQEHPGITDLRTSFCYVKLLHVHI